MDTIYESEEEVREAIIETFDKTTGRGDVLRAILGAGAGIAAAGLGAGLLSGAHADAASLGLRSGRNHLGVPKSDIDILNYALTLEHLEAAFYTGVTYNAAPTLQALSYAHIVARHERAHVDALTKAISSLGGAPVSAKTYKFPKFSFPFVIAVENLGVHAYLGAAPMIQTATLLLTAATIVTVEARHAAAWASLNDMPDFTLGAFDTGLPMKTVVTAVGPYFAS